MQTLRPQKCSEMICLSWGPECGGVLANIGFLPAVFLEAEVLLCSWAGGGGWGMHFIKPVTPVIKLFKFQSK